MRDILGNMKDLTTMENNLRKVLKIEPMDSYIKRSIGPMVAIEISGISRLLKYAKIPLVDSNNPNRTFIFHKITYLGLPN
jgi:hypothetical protein